MQPCTERSLLHLFISRSLGRHKIMMVQQRKRQIGIKVCTIKPDRARSTTRPSSYSPPSASKSPNLKAQNNTENRQTALGIGAIISVTRCEETVTAFSPNRPQIGEGPIEKKKHRYCVAHKREAIASRLNRSGWRIRVCLQGKYTQKRANVSG